VFCVLSSIPMHMSIILYCSEMEILPVLLCLVMNVSIALIRNIKRYIFNCFCT
jgi:hypothetical protein